MYHLKPFINIAFMLKPQYLSNYVAVTLSISVVQYIMKIGINEINFFLLTIAHDTFINTIFHNLFPGLIFKKA